MKTALIALTTLLFLCGTVFSAEDPNLPDTLKIDSVAAWVTGTAIVPVTFFNDEELAGLEVTLTHNSLDVVLDSFSFVGGRLDGAQFSGVAYTNDSSSITIFALDAIAEGTGLLGNLYYSWQPLIQPQLVTVDTTSVTIGQIYWSTTFSFEDTIFNPFVPIVQAGLIDIQQEPIDLDSVWLEDIEAAAGDKIAIDVFFFNEDPVHEIRLALDYATDLLHYDSVTIDGMRIMPTPINSPVVQNQISTHELLLRLTFPTGDSLVIGTGPIARLHFTVDASTPAATYIIDTTSFAGLISSLVTRPASLGGKVFVPFFNAGSVTVQVGTDVRQIDNDKLPSSFALSQNYPNPFNPTTQIRFSLPRGGPVSLDIYNVLGRRVVTIVDRIMAAGVHEVTFDGRNEDGQALASGVYFYRLSHPDYVENKKMILLK